MRLRIPALLTAFSLLSTPAFADPAPDLKNFHTVSTDKTTAIEKASATAGARPGYLGVEFANGDSTAPVVAGVEPASPAQAAGILPGDIISKIGAVEVPNARALRETIQPLGEGATVPVHLTRSGKDARISYFICPEGGETMTSISVFCHEFGHMLGLPDLNARPENPGSEGVGVWCLMATELQKGRPQHNSAWCKEKLGWLKPAVIDPTEKQKLIRAPVEGSSTECSKVLIRRDTSEYLLLKNRQQRDFDTGLPAAGLLVWRVVGDHPIPEESHGIEGPLGPRVFLNSIPFPSPSNHAFTPDTHPSSRSLLGGDLPVHIHEIRQLPDGRITFTIGHSYQ